jgi:diguanylate cyclase (GGDEF)-like protein
MNNTYLQVQLIVVGLLSSIGLLTLGRWLRTTEYRVWSSAWLGWSAGITCLTLGSLFPALSELALFLHALAAAFFSFCLVYGCLLTLQVVDVQRIGILRTGWIAFGVVLFISLFVIAFRWWYLRHPVELFRERHYWSGPWLISSALFSIWMIALHVSNWTIRPTYVLLVFALILFALNEALCLGLTISAGGPAGDSSAHLVEFLQDLSPILVAFLALAMHTQALDGLVHHLERTLVRASKRSAKLKMMAERDPLTAVMNRHAFYSMVGDNRDEPKSSIGGSVAVLDIDNLKPLNDTYGHQAGDAAIRAVAKAIRSVIRAEDLLFRWGGDEFLVILPHVHMDEARWRFQKLDHLLQKTTLPAVKKPLPITLSIGISPFSSNVSLEKAIELADERMYAEKAEKKHDSGVEQI